MAATSIPASDAISYRAQPIRSLCVTCNEEAHLSCSRCGAPHCEPHLPSSELRCSRCEAFYATARAHRIARPLEAWMLALIYVFVGMMGASLSWIAATREWLYDLPMALLWALGLVLCCGLTPLWVALLRRARLRPIFLSEAPRRRRVAVPEIDIDPPRQHNEHETLAIISASLLGLLFVPLVIPLAGIVVAISALLLGRRQASPPSRTAIIALALHGLLLMGEVVFLISLAW